ncbi:hypothetical protein [Pseudorhodoferax sp.]|uniref:hypothetical protein n=1 Tax=Pseudorhodoferax sp. TaxID=1993553 RepID=UPI002DD646D2|nr:hypothetical protein [Pseudorhodoferax sp.]
MGTDTTGDNALPENDLQRELAARFRPFVSIFGSVAVISAFLLFAGFLSDYGAYRMAGLPRFSFSFTAMVENGADVVVDMLSLLAQGTRVFWLFALIGSVILLWSWHRHPRVNAWARSRRLYRLCRLLMLMLAFVLFASLVDRAQRSLIGETYSAAAVERGLRDAYADGFPDPYLRQRAIDREGYELRFFRLPNWAVTMEDGWRWVKARLPGLIAERPDDTEPGIALRNLAESRRDARHVFGWLALSLIASVLVAALMQWWKAGLAWSPEPSVGRRVLLRWLDGDMDGAIDRLVVPLTILLLSIAAMLLPLAHGVLARKSLGGEHVMVYLKGPDGAATEEFIQSDDKVEIKRERPVLRPEPSTLKWPQGRFDCTSQAASSLDNVLAEHNEALRDLTQERKAHSKEHRSAFQSYVRRLDQVAEAVVALNCAEAVRQFWAIKPPIGLAAQEPDIAESYRRAATRVAMAYGLRIGTILAYPRDAQALTLVDSIVPRSAMQSPAWSLQAVDAARVAETVVLPDLFRRGMQRVGEILQVEPDHADIAKLLVAPSSEALEVVLPLLRGGRLLANGRGVSVTAMGAMAWISTFDKPHLSHEAIDLLADLTGTSETSFWPGKDERVRGAAVTALHLTRSPYAAHRLAQHVGQAGPAQCARTSGATQVPAACLPQTSTAAGYLLQDLAAEERRLGLDKPIPKALSDARGGLEGYLNELLTAEGISEDVRAAACTAVVVAGGIRMHDPQQIDTFLRWLAPEELHRFLLSSANCAQNSHRLGLPQDRLRPVLRDIVLRKAVPGLPDKELTRLRIAALMALVDLGLSSETDTIMSFYLREPAESIAGESARSVISELAEKGVTAFIDRCVFGASGRPQHERVLCLQAFEYTKDNIDGDEGSATKLRDLVLADDEDESVRVAACGALRVFRERGGNAAGRIDLSDHPRLQCLEEATESPAKPDSIDPGALEDLLRQMFRKQDANAAAQATPST